MKNLLTLLLSVLLVSCAISGKPTYDVPVSYDPNAPAEWKLGWQHGCESGYSAYGNDWYKSIYKFKQDVTMVKNEYYFKAWNDGFGFCRAYINRRLSGDYFEHDDVSGLFSSRNLNIAQAGRRDDTGLVKAGLFGTGGKDNLGLFGSTFEAYAPGYGSMTWGSNADRCDWLNRCGEDKPNDPVGSWWGEW